MCTCLGLKFKSQNKGETVNEKVDNGTFMAIIFINCNFMSENKGI